MRYLIFSILFGLSTFATGQTGPGGVLDASNNRFWFDANELTLSDNANVSLWTNLGGNTNSAAQTTAGRQPTFQSDAGNTMNGYPVIQFDGTNDFLEIADNSDMNTSVSATRSYFFTIRTGADVTSRQVIYEEGGTIRGLNIYIFNGNVYIGAYNLNNDGTDAPWGFSSVNTVVTANTEYIVGLVFNGNTSITGTIDGYLNGTNFGTINNVGRLYAHSADIGIGAKNNDTFFETGSSSGDGNYFGGEISEFIQYTIAFNDAQVTLIQNYLSSKYNIPLAIGDEYNMDNVLNGEYDHQVAGIGQANNGTNSLDGQGRSILRCNSPSAIGNNEFLIWGNDLGGITETLVGTPATVDYRLNQVWKFDENGEVGTINLSFDLGLIATSGNAVGDFFILVDGVDTDFSDAAITNASSFASGIVTFNGVNINAGDHVTLGINISATGNTGPGGVQHSDRYTFWFRAHDLDATLTDGQTVSAWINQGANSTNATQNSAGARPTYQNDAANSMNNYSTLDFLGNDRLQINNNTDINTSPTVISRSYHMAFRTGSNITNTQMLFEEGGTIRGMNFYINGGNLYFGAWNTPNDGPGSPWGFSSVNTAITANTNYELSMIYKGNSSISGIIECFLNGSLVGTISNVGVLYAHAGGNFLGGTDGCLTHTGTVGSGSSFFTGKIAEFVIYNHSINDAQRIIVDNYLSAKYGIVMGSDDNYLMDNSANGDFDHEMAGIGQEDAANTHIDAKGSGIVRMSSPDALNDGDYLLWGHNDDELCNSDDVPPGVNNRLIRIWRASETSDVGNVELSFDLSGFNYGTLSNTRLLIDTDGVFSNANVVAPSSTSGDVVSFAGINLSDQNYFTIGTLDAFTDLTRDTTIWNGSISTNWGTPGNWSTGIPDTNSTVLIPNTAPLMPVINSTSECFHLNIQSGASLEITGTNRLDVHGNWINDGSFIRNSSHVVFNGFCGRGAIQINGNQEFFDITIDKIYDIDLISGSINLIGTLKLNNGVFSTNDSLTLISDALGTARIAEITNGSITGEIVMQRYIDAGQTNWRFLTHAVSGADLEQFNDDFITSGFPGTNWPNWPNPTNPWVSMFFYDENLGTTFDDGFVAPSSTNDLVAPGQGVWIWCGDTITGTQPFTIDSRGPANTGQINLPVSFNPASGNMDNDGWNMVANPYPCTIDWDETGWTKTNIEDAIYVWNPDLGVYASYIAGAGTDGGSQFVASSQAFFVHADAANPVLTIEENCKVDQDQNFIKASSITTDLLRLKLSYGSDYDETVLRFDPLATNNYDSYADARKIKSNWVSIPLLSSNYNGFEYSINTLSSDSLHISVPLNVYPNQSGTHEITATDLTAIQNMNCVILEDLVTGHMQNLLVDTTYSFNMTLTESKQRFMLHFSQAIVANGTQVNCAGESNGEIEISGMGSGYLYDVLGNGNSYSGTAQSGTLVLDSLQAGTYSVLVNDPYGLCPSNSTQVIITDPLPISYTAQITHETCVGCCDGEISLIPSGGTGQINVYTNGTLISPGNQLSNLCAGIYMFELTDDNGCVHIATEEVDNLTDIHEKENLHFTIYPNPVQSELNVAFNGRATLRVLDLEGRLLTIKEAIDGSTINVSTLASGIYLLRVSSSKGESTVRFRVH